MANAPADPGKTDDAQRVISANAAKVLETTRRAWQPSAVHVPGRSESERAGRPSALPPPSPAASKKRITPPRCQRANLLAALNYWSPRPL